MLIKVEGLARPEREDGLPDAHKTTYINFAWVEDLRAGKPVYATDDDGKTIVDKDGNKVVKHGTRRKTARGKYGAGL
ncbi:MAG: hypothetical protein F4Z29_05575 [Gemmatimonadetes bacterium]|nr:hypothetical protein [Gemmatimonadota bacterium]